MEKGPYHIDLESDCFYHMFSRGEADEIVFRCEENYFYFLRKLPVYTDPICSILAFSLMPNHFHFLIRVKSEEELKEAFTVNALSASNRISEKLPTFDLSKFVLQQFSNFLNSYTKSFNKMHHRKGGLFMNRIRRAKVNKETDFSNFVFYIHKNAVHHGLTERIGQWKFDSYNAILSEKPTSLDRQFVIDWFGSKSLFVDFHKQQFIQLEGS